jgi:hypothetical protein
MARAGIDRLRDEADERALAGEDDDGVLFDQVDPLVQEMFFRMMTRHLGSPRDRDMERHLRSLRRKMEKEQEL